MLADEGEGTVVTVENEFKGTAVNMMAARVNEWAYGDAREVRERPTIRGPIRSPTSAAGAAVRAALRRVGAGRRTRGWAVDA